MNMVLFFFSHTISKSSWIQMYIYWKYEWYMAFLQTATLEDNVVTLTTKQLDIANVSSFVLLSIIVFAQLALPIIINKKW